jgi:hypothetical protein
MVKPPKIRHSKSRKEPLTIELGPDEVSRIDPAKAEEPATEAATPDVAASEATERPSHLVDAPAAEPSEQVAAEVSAGPDMPSADEAATAEAKSGAAGTEAVAETATETEAANTDATSAKRPAEEDTTIFMGSEWPPEPQSTTDAEASPEEERVSHAFGRDPDTPPPSSAPHAERGAEEPPIQAAPVPERRRSGLSAVAAGIIGGVITLLGAGALHYAGVLPSPGGGTTAPAGEAEAIAALKTELAALKEEVDQVRAGAGDDTSGFTQQVTDLSTNVQGLSGALDQVKADVAALKNAVSQGGAGEGAAVEALNQKVAELEKSVAALGQAGSAVTQETVDAINQKLASVETAAAEAAAQAKAGEGRLAALEQSVASLTEKLSQQAAQPKVALAIAAAALKSAIERGGPFTAEVETFAAIAPDAPELPQLRAIAEKGVASRSDLIAGMDDAADAMIAAAEQPDEDAGFWENLVDSAESLVQVRPIGEVEGDTVPAKVARMEVALKAGELTKALAEFDTLPEPSKAAGQAFAELIRTRVTAEELVAKALAGALKA